ncbi:MAG: aspartate/glutamate racemase family protein [Gammaproteobacteria bacterium]
MKIALINPNSTAAMTEKARRAAEQFAFLGTEIRASNPPDSPPSIEGHYDEAACLPGLLAEVRKAEEWGADGIAVACFDDPGLAACREIAAAPVVGMCEAAMHFASLVASSFSVITTLPRAVPIIEELARKYGKTHLCKKVRAADIPVLALEEDAAAAEEKIGAETARAVAEDGCEAVILGCAGMADLTARLSEKYNIPVIDGVVCAVKLCEALAGAGLQTSKICAYAYPRKK